MNRIAALAAVLATTAAIAAPRTAPKKLDTDTYHGVAVTDDYHWLEDGSDKGVQK